MAVPNSTYSEIATTTIESRTGTLADNVTKNNALLYKLNQKGRKKFWRGGHTILQEIFYQENQTYKRYAGWEKLNIAPSDVITTSHWSPKQAAVAVMISGLEILQNSGKEAFLDLLEARVENAEQTLENNIAVDCYSDGTSDSGKQIGGLAYIIDPTPATGTVGGIDSSAWTFWQNISADATTTYGAAATAANIQSYMNQVWLQVVRGKDRPDLICADNNYYRHYWESLQAIQRIASDEMATAGFMSLKYMDADVVFDGGIGGGAGTNTMYFINSRYMHWRPHVDRDFVALDPDRYSTDQDGIAKLIGFAGNLTCSGRLFQAVLKD